MSQMRTMGRDLVSALAVLVLILLSVAPHSPAVASGYNVSADYDAQSVCGDPGTSGFEHHVPCHGCRAAPVDLPAPPCSVEPAFLALEVIFVPAPSYAPLSAAIHSIHSPRAPPRFV